ncbi:hypothetical protein BC830DRAFT_1084025 [Chytriomyces sp. MP71]|nr:hypothetical protein BC830DRAFT_1084025 [Chytriomyces sp. MP71]
MYQRDYKAWCRNQQYPDGFVEQQRILRYLQCLETRPAKQRGRKFTKSFQRQTVRTVNGVQITIETPTKDQIMSQKTNRFLNDHTIKLQNQTRIVLSIKSFLAQHNQKYEQAKEAHSEDAGLKDISMRLQDQEFLAVARQQLARDWHLKDMFLFQLEEESIGVVKGEIQARAMTVWPQWTQVDLLRL